MTELHPPRWIGPLMSAWAGIAGLYGLWCTVIAFIGGTWPLTEIEVQGSILLGLIVFFIGEPVIMTLAYWSAMLVLTPLAMVFARRAA